MVEVSKENTDEAEEIVTEAELVSVEDDNIVPINNNNILYIFFIIREKFN